MLRTSIEVPATELEAGWVLGIGVYRVGGSL